MVLKGGYLGHDRGWALSFRGASKTSPGARRTKPCSTRTVGGQGDHWDLSLIFCCANEADVVGDSTQDHNVDMDPCTQIQCIRLARHWPNPP